MNRCPTLAELPLPPSGKTGWPWTEESPQLPETMPALSGTAGPASSPWPRISIVTPSYNQGQFIEETIRSVLLQGYTNLEYIVIDGGSNDESLQIINKYQHWLKYWISEPDRGQSHAINKGLEHCSGDIFNWINSDDLLVPGALHAVAMAWHKTRHVVIAGRVMNFDAEGEEQLISPNALSLENFVNIRKARENALMWHQPGTFLPRTGVSRIGGVQEGLVFNMDHFLMIALLQSYDVVYVPDILARFRLHDNSKTLTYGFLQFKLERVKKLRTMKDLQKYVTTRELKQEHVSLLLAYADMERSKSQYVSFCRYRAKAFAASPFLTMVILLRRGWVGRIIQRVKRRGKNISKPIMPGS
jgi:glycosyltransferase involved in cell wall biosynthesis